MEQRSEEWFAARCGKFTSSRFDDLMARTKKGMSARHTNLIIRVSIERLTSRHFDTYQTAAMAGGRNLEEQARQAYEIEHGVMTEEVGICLHPTLGYISVSPDGYVEDDGVLEIKCPFVEAKHFGALRNDEHVAEYWWQIQGLLWVTGRRWCDMVSFDPRWPEDVQLAVKRVYRKESDIESLEEMCRTSEIEVLATIDEIERRRDEQKRLRLDRQDGKEPRPVGKDG